MGHLLHRYYEDLTVLRERREPAETPKPKAENEVKVPKALDAEELLREAEAQLGTDQAMPLSFASVESCAPHLHLGPITANGPIRGSK